MNSYLLDINVLIILNSSQVSKLITGRSANKNTEMTPVIILRKIMLNLRE